jgi:hypothetical protein
VATWLLVVVLICVGYVLAGLLNGVIGSLAGLRRELEGVSLKLEQIEADVSQLGQIAGHVDTLCSDVGRIGSHVVDHLPGIDSCADSLAELCRELDGVSGNLKQIAGQVDILTLDVGQIESHLAPRKSDLS